MKCERCKREATVRLAHLGALCDQCFCAIIEKRIRKHTRVNKIFSKGDRIIAVGSINHHLIPHILEGLPVTIVNKKTAPARQSATQKIITVWTADDEACDFLSHVLAGTRRKQTLSILKATTDEELMHFSICKKIAFAPNKKDPQIATILKTLERKHPETTFSLVKSASAFQ
jgi:hypothetical protein